MMTIEVQDRMRLEDRLREVLGSPEAATLISYLPRDAPEDLVTKEDLELLRSDIRRLEKGQDGLHASQEDLRAGQEDLRAGQEDLRAGQARVEGEVRELRLELKADMAELRSDVRGDILEAIGKANRNTILAVASTLTGSVTIALAILRLTS